MQDVDAQIAAIEFAHKLATMSPAVVDVTPHLYDRSQAQDIYQRMIQVAENLREELKLQALKRESECQPPGYTAGNSAVDIEVQTSVQEAAAVIQHGATSQDGSVISQQDKDHDNLSTALLSPISGHCSTTPDRVPEHLSSSPAGTSHSRASNQHTGSHCSDAAACVHHDAASMATASVISDVMQSEAVTSGQVADTAPYDGHSYRSDEQVESLSKAGNVFSWFYREAEEQHKKQLARLTLGIDKTCRATKRTLAQMRAMKQKLGDNDPKHQKLETYETLLLLNIEQSQAGIEQQRTLLEQQLQQQHLFWRFLEALSGQSEGGAVSVGSYQYALSLAVGNADTMLTGGHHSSSATATPENMPDMLLLQRLDEQQGLQASCSVSSIDYSLEYESHTRGSWPTRISGNEDAPVSINSIESSSEQDHNKYHQFSSSQRGQVCAMSASDDVLARQVEELRNQVSYKESMRGAPHNNITLRQELHTLNQRNAQLDAELATINRTSTIHAERYQDDMYTDLCGTCYSMTFMHSFVLKCACLGMGCRS